MSNEKSTGCDNIPARFLKDAASIVCNPLAYVFNLSIRKCQFPNDFKSSRVVPLYKNKAHAFVNSKDLKSN